MPGGDFSGFQAPTFADVLPDDMANIAIGGGKGGGKTKTKTKTKTKASQSNDTGTENAAPNNPENEQPKEEVVTTPLQKAKALAKSVLLGFV